MGWFSKSSSVSQTAGSANQQPQTTLSDKVEMLRAQFGLDKELKSHEVVSIAVERLEQRLHVLFVACEQLQLGVLGGDAHPAPSFEKWDMLNVGTA